MRGREEKSKRREADRKRRSARGEIKTGREKERRREGGEIDTRVKKQKQGQGWNRWFLTY